MGDTPAEWARKRAAHLSMQEPAWPLGLTMTAGDFGPGGIAMAFARYIEAHEEPPVDPLLIEAREMFAIDHTNGEFSLSAITGNCVMKYGAGNEEIRAGKHDRNPIVQRYLRALRRGMELAKGEPPHA